MSKINLQQIAIEEVGEVPSKVPGCLEDLKCWLTKQSHFRCRLDDEFLLQFLRGCRYDVEKVKRKLQNFYTFKTLCPDYFGTVNVNRHKFRQMHDIGSICILPKPLSEVGPRIVFYRYLYSLEFMEEAIEVCLATLETLIVSDPHACICGVVYIFDMSDITMNHILAYTPDVLKKLSIFYEKVIPFQTKGFYFMNVPEFAENFFNLYLPSLSEELRESVFVCGQNITHITDKIPLKYLPKEYGGENGCLRDLLKEFHTVWNKHSEYFLENHKFGIKADLRWQVVSP
uniref:CRAL-TRIO domain-containing protein n=1 Tax=Musca domestica TaxID=7370 RepID=A0A1I8M8S5_MUSDO